MWRAEMALRDDVLVVGQGEGDFYKADELFIFRTRK